MEKQKTTHEKEEQLLLSAWQKLVVNLNRNSTDERINNIGNSFLSQQRSLSKRQSLSTSIPAAIQNHSSSSNNSHSQTKNGTS